MKMNSLAPAENRSKKKGPRFLQSSNQYNPFNESESDFYKCGLEVVEVQDEEKDSYGKKTFEDGLGPFNSTRFGRSSVTEENFLDYSHLALKMKNQDHRKGGTNTDRELALIQKIMKTKNLVENAVQQYQEYKRNTEEYICSFSEYFAKSIKQIVVGLSETMEKYSKQHQKKLEYEIKALTEQNEENKQSIFESHLIINDYQQKLSRMEDLAKRLKQEKQVSDQQNEELRREIDSQKRNPVSKFEIPKTDIESSFKQIEIEELKNALLDIQKENSYLKMALEAKSTELDESRGDHDDFDKERYLTMIEKFQEEVEYLESEIRQLRRQDKLKSEEMKNWEMDLKEQKRELQRNYQIYYQKEDFLKQYEWKLKMKEESLALMKEEALQNYEMGQYNNYRSTIQPSGRDMGSPKHKSRAGFSQYYSPKSKINLLAEEKWEFQPSKRVRTEKKGKERDDIDSRIERIQNSLHRQLNLLSRRP